MTIRSRLAPTPSGKLHVGNACAFVLTWVLTRRVGGHLHLRIDDLDAARCRPAYVEDIFRTLDWLGLDYDAGSQGPDDFYRHHSQQYRLDAYRATLDQLGPHLFACTCSRRQVQAQAPDGTYPGTCRTRGLTLSQPGVAWRFRTDARPVTFDDVWRGPLRWPLAADTRDPVVRRRDGLPAYHIATLTDDRHMDINLVVRGADLLPSTALQIRLAECLGWTAQTRIAWLHHPLLTDAHGQKLSKSQGAPDLRQVLATSTPVYQHVARWLGAADPTAIRTLADLRALPPAQAGPVR